MKGRVYYYEADNLKLVESLARYRFALPFLKGKDVLDVGCGARKGPLVLSGPARRVVALDISEEAIRHCVKSWPSTKVKYLTASALALPFSDESFDAVVSFEVIEHLKEADLFLNGIRRVLKKGGILILSTPNKDAMAAAGIVSNPDHVKEFSVAELRAFLGKFFENVEFYGQRPQARVRLIKENREDSYRLVAKVPLALRHLLPRGIRDILFRLYARLFSKMKSGLEEMQITTDDFPIRKGEISESHYLVVFCRKAL